MTLRSNRHGFESGAHRLLAVGPRAGFLPSLILRFLVCEKRVMIGTIIGSLEGPGRLICVKHPAQREGLSK